MTNKEYREKTKRTLPDLGISKTTGDQITNFTKEHGDQFNLDHMILGLNGEIGELVKCVGTELKLRVDKINLSEELGDIYWYISNYCNFRNLPIPEDVETTLPNDMCLDLLIISIADLTDIVKKQLAYGRIIEKSKELEIIYNIYTALLLFENTYDIQGSIIRDKNIAKLTVRYPDKYNDVAALNRNLVAERKTLE